MLIEAAPYVNKTLHLPHLACLGPIFPGIEKAAPAIHQVAGCCACLVQLLHEKDFGAHLPGEVQLIDASAQIYQREMQRQLGGLFPTNHPYWAQFYKRLQATNRYDRDDGVKQYFSDPARKPGAHHFKHRYGLILIPLDALHDLHGRKKQLEYELLAQSIMEVYYGAFHIKQGTKEIAGEHFRKAISLTKHLSIAQYQAWISGLMTHLVSFQTPQ